jgi:hypothetical protein
MALHPSLHLVQFFDVKEQWQLAERVEALGLDMEMDEKKKSLYKRGRKELDKALENAFSYKKALPPGE